MHHVLLKRFLGFTVVSAILLGSLLVATAQAQAVPPGSSHESENPVLPTPTPIPEDRSRSYSTNAEQASGASGPTITIAPPTSPVTEGGTIYFQLTASSASSDHIEINLRTSGGSSFLSDTPVSSIGLGPGLTTAHLILSTDDDDVDESDATITARITSGTGYVVGSPSSATISILDNDQPEVSFGSRSYSVNEGSRVSIFVSFDKAGISSLNIPVTVSPGNNRTITFGRGTIGRSFTYTAPQDTDCDDNRVTLKFGTLPSGVSRGSPSSASISVKDDDRDCPVPTPTVMFSASSYSADEGEEERVTVRLSGKSSQRLTIPIDIESGDYSTRGLSNDSVTFEIGGTSKSFWIEPDEDSDCDDERLKLSFGALPSGVGLGSPSEAAFNIDDDEDPSVCDPTPPPPPRATPLPVITIERVAPRVNEGNSATFVLRISPTQTPRMMDLNVNINVDDSGSFLKGSPPTQTIFNRNSTRKTLKLETLDDMVDKANGKIEVTVKSGTGYTVGTPSSASVIVLDDDILLAPTDLRANGHLTNDRITLRWSSVSGASSYSVRYVEEICSSNGVCAPDTRGPGGPLWRTAPSDDVTISGTTVIEARLRGLAEGTLYRVEVQAGFPDTSPWSEFVFVYPTDSPLDSDTEVATAPFHGYQAKNSQGSHDFRYVLCEETIPTGLAMDAQDMKDAVEEWEDTVVWDEGNGANIITTTAYALPPGEQCRVSGAPPIGRFEVAFSSASRVKSACGNPFPWGDSPPACWRSRSLTRVGLQSISNGRAYFNVDHGVAHWNAALVGGCKKLQETLIHEVGHAFGIGRQHPVNTAHSIMSYQDPTNYCSPQAYDIVAMMANYQSR